MRGMRVNMNKTKWRTSEASSSKESRVVYVAEVLVVIQYNVLVGTQEVLWYKGKHV